MFLYKKAGALFNLTLFFILKARNHSIEYFFLILKRLNHTAVFIDSPPIIDHYLIKQKLPDNTHT